MDAVLELLFPPSIGDYVVVVEIPILGNITRHPISRALKHEQIENAIIDGCSTLGLFPEIETTKTPRKLCN